MGKREISVAKESCCGCQACRQKKTKYVQSDMGGVYLEARQHLAQGRWVLFCGTPCQVRALKLF